MIIVYILLVIDPTCDVDSLEAALARDVRLPTVLALNTCYMRRGEYTRAIELMAEYEEKVPVADRPVVVLHRADDYLFTGGILEAREAYLGLVAAYPSTGTANDALERLYLIEKNRKDMPLLKRLTRAMGLIHTAQYRAAEDSLRVLLTTDVGIYAYVFLAHLYSQQDDLPRALGVFDELHARFPDHTVDHARIARSMLYLQVGDTLHARNILEDLILLDPQSLFADRAREILRTILDKGAGDERSDNMIHRPPRE
jgi:tetratricopeptide (TPR) repeat protein